MEEGTEEWVMEPPIHGLGGWPIRPLHHGQEGAPKEVVLQGAEKAPTHLRVDPQLHVNEIRQTRSGIQRGRRDGALPEKCRAGKILKVTSGIRELRKEKSAKEGRASDRAAVGIMTQKADVTLPAMSKTPSKRSQMTTSRASMIYPRGSLAKEIQAADGT